jgi:pSer/pThr/pTyr-binding forkhead associated (FHA) protein
MTVRITILRGPNVGRTYDYEDEVITIGSGRNNTLVIHDNDVAKVHCTLMRIDTDYDIQDNAAQQSARYATYVNGQQLAIDEKWLLKSSSIIELGNHVTLEYRVEGNKKSVAGPIFMHAGDPGSQPCLVLVENAKIRAAYLLQSREISIGRASGNDIIIQQNEISRQHTKLRLYNGRYFIEDNQSRNGTFLNGVAVTEPVVLNHSDVIRLGSATQLHYVYRADLPEEWDPATTDNSLPVIGKDDPNDSTMPQIAIPRRLGTSELAHDHTSGSLTDHIIVVYAREDWEDVVAPIVLNLEDAKQKVWVDQHLRPNSDPWRAAIEHAQSECWLVVVVASPQALETPFVKDTCRYFFNREKPILLVDYKPVRRLPFELSQAPVIEYDRNSPGKMFRRLLYEIMQLKPRYGK